MKYKLVADTRILHNGKTYVTGDELELTDDEAAKLGVFIKRLEEVPTGGDGSASTATTETSKVVAEEASPDQEADVELASEPKTSKRRKG